MLGNNCKTRDWLPKDLGKRLASYSTMAAGISLAFAPHANAADKCNILEMPLIVNTSSGNVYIDIDGDGNNDFSFEASFDGYYGYVMIWRVDAYGRFDASNWEANRLNQGEIVNANVNSWAAALLYTYYGDWSHAQFNNGQEGYIVSERKPPIFKSGLIISASYSHN